MTHPISLFSRAMLCECDNRELRMERWRRSVPRGRRGAASTRSKLALIVFCYRWRSCQLKLVLLDDTLIRFTLALDAILASSFALRKLRENLVETRHRVAQGNSLAEPNHISNRKPVAHGCVMMHFSHVIPAWI